MLALTLLNFSSLLEQRTRQSPAHNQSIPYIVMPACGILQCSKLMSIQDELQHHVVMHSQHAAKSADKQALHLGCLKAQMLGWRSISAVLKGRQLPAQAR